jgi:hypothetical protein
MTPKSRFQGKMYLEKEKKKSIIKLTPTRYPQNARESVKRLRVISNVIDGQFP